MNNSKQDGLDISVVSEAAASRYGDYRSRMDSSRITFSKSSKELAAERLAYLGQLEVPPSSVPMFDLERTSNEVLHHLTEHNVKQLLISSMAVLGVLRGNDPRTVFRLTKDIRVPDEVTRLRKENERLSGDIVIAQATAVNAKRYSDKLEAKIEELEEQLVAKPEDTAAFEQALQTNIEASDAFGVYGEPLLALFDQVIEALELNKENPDSDFIVGTLQHVMDAMSNVILPWKELARPLTIPAAEEVPPDLAERIASAAPEALEVPIAPAPPVATETPEVSAPVAAPENTTMPEATEVAAVSEPPVAETSTEVSVVETPSADTV
jgi:hypothetical protein